MCVVTEFPFGADIAARPAVKGIHVLEGPGPIAVEPVFRVRQWEWELAGGLALTGLTDSSFGAYFSATATVVSIKGGPYTFALAQKPT